MSGMEVQLPNGMRKASVHDPLASTTADPLDACRALWTVCPRMEELISPAPNRQSEHVASIMRRRAELARWLWDLSKSPLPGREGNPGPGSCRSGAPLVAHASQVP